MGSLERVLEHDVAMMGSQTASKKGGVLRNAHFGEDIDFAPEPEDEKNLEPSPLAVVDAVYDDDADDDIMDLGIQLGKLRLTDRLGGFFRPRMSEELSTALNDSRLDKRSPSEKSESPSQVKSKLQSFLAPGPTYIAPTSSFFFSSGKHGTSLIDFLPSKLAADRLLQQYWFAVHPISRSVHRPSFQRRYDTFWHEVQLGIEPVGSLQAVVFAAMFSGVVSMPEDVINSDFGVAKKDLVENFQQGTETALGRANILRTTKVESLQAFVMYLIPLCRDQMSRSHSALTGTAIRLAECMGLHRDGTEYGIGPLETHVRRLVWYQLCFLDIRTCEAQGPRPGIREEEFDTKLPLNVNELDMEGSPPLTESVTRWTDMTLPLIRMECNEMHRVIWMDRPRLQQKKMSLTALLGKIENFRNEMRDKYIPMLDERIPLHRYARSTMDLLCVRMHIMVLHRYHNSVPQAIPDRLRQIILTSGTEQLEIAMEMETSASFKPWVWYTGAYQQYQTAFLLLVEIWAFPQRKEADRIWTCLDYVFEIPSYLSRGQKARTILTEIRDRIGVYQDARKLRAPKGMVRHIGVQPTGSKGVTREASHSPGSIELMPSPPDSNDHASPHSEPVPLSPLKNEVPSIENGPQGLYTNTPAFPAPKMNANDDLMADIDWNEWDKLFPPDINTGDIDSHSY